MGDIPTRTEAIRSLANQLREIAPDFADRIAPVYAALDWRWHDEPDPPDSDAILRNLLQKVDEVESELLTQSNVKLNGLTMSSGGLWVTIERADSDDDLHFLERWQGQIGFSETKEVQS